MKVYVLPLKNGMWRVSRMNEARHGWWVRAWRAWWDRKGHRLEISPEMWVEV